MKKAIYVLTQKRSVFRAYLYPRLSMRGVRFEPIYNQIFRRVVFFLVAYTSVNYVDQVIQMVKWGKGGSIQFNIITILQHILLFH